VRVEAKLTPQPGFRSAPFTLCGRWRHVKHTCSLFDRQSAEGAEFHDSREVFIHTGQAIEGLIECKDRDPIWRGHFHGFINRDTRESVASLARVVASGVINEDPTHDLRCHSEKVSSTPPIDVALVDQSQIHLVNQGGGLKGVAGSLASKPTGRDPAQLRVDERQQLVEGIGVTAPPFSQKRRYVGPGRHVDPQIVVR
jgi:hypothetical protein